MRITIQKVDEWVKELRKQSDNESEEALLAKLPDDKLNHIGRHQAYSEAARYLEIQINKQWKGH
jgi:hypothetical protein